MIEREHIAIAARHIVEGETRGEGDGGLAALHATMPICRDGASARFEEVTHGKGLSSRSHNRTIREHVIAGLVPAMTSSIR